MSSLLVAAVIDVNGATRHDRTAKAFRRWARAAQSITRHPSSDTLLVSTERVVHHRCRDRRPRSHPLLVAIATEDLQAGQSPLGITGHRRGEAT